MSRRLVVWGVLVVGFYCALRMLLADQWDLAVVSAISVAVFLLDYWVRHYETDNS